jgi:hypothetical protein
MWAAALALVLGCGDSDGASTTEGGGEGGDATSDSEGGGDTDTEELAVAAFTATVQTPADDAARDVVGNLAMDCRFESASQLRITATALTATVTDTFTLRIGVYKTADVGGAGAEFAFTGIEDGSNVDIDSAAIAYERSGGGGAVEADLVVSGKVTLTSLDPCTGTFEASLQGAYLGEVGLPIAIDAAAFEITRSE